VNPKDAFSILELMQNITGEPPVMWGPSIIGFGTCHYKYASGLEGDWMLTGFSSRKHYLTLYFMTGPGGYGELLKKLESIKLVKLVYSLKISTL